MLFSNKREFGPGMTFLVIFCCLCVGLLLNVLLFPLLLVQDNIAIGKITTMLSTILTFGVPAFLTAFILRIDENVANYLCIKRAKTYLPKFLLYILVVLLMLSLLPVINFIGALNANYSFPEALKPLEEFFRNQEQESIELTTKMLTVDNFAGCLLNLLVIAVTPAICEELFFRGVLQRSFMKYCKKPFWAIFVTALIFSAIHMQFSGLIPRFILGFVLGYLYYKTSSIWVSTLAHFVNNGIVVIVAYFYDVDAGNSTDISSYASIQWILAIIFGLLVAGVCAYFIFYRKRKKEASN